MTDNNRSGGSEDPLENYRHALNRRQSTEKVTQAGPEDPLASGGAQPATSGDAQGVAKPGEDLPSELEDTLNRYQKALGKCGIDHSLDLLIVATGTILSNIFGDRARHARAY